MKDRRRVTVGSAGPVIPTGNVIVKFKPGVATTEAIKALSHGNSVVAASSDFSASDFSSSGVEALVLEKIGAAIVRLDPGERIQVRTRSLRARNEILKVEPEFYVFSHDFPGDGGEPVVDDEETTWGVHVVRADRCHLSGRNIKIAILDTGFDINHPDFKNRSIMAWSAIEGERADIDLQGHGTHCTGIAAGPGKSRSAPRYGVAHEADIHIYKVIGNAGHGTDGSVLAGIDRALADECAVISMSFGRAATLDSGPSEVYEQVAQAALAQGCLMIAAAGNSSSRDLGYVAPIDYPANSPSIMAISAVTSLGQIPNFSCGASNPQAEIALVAPGSAFSSFPMPRRYRRLRGTSMAAPHVAGVACLWAQHEARLRGQALRDALITHAKLLKHSAVDVGAGLVQAPA